MKANWLWLAAGLVIAVTGGLWASGRIDVKAMAGLKADGGNPAKSTAAPPPSITVVRPVQRSFSETLRVNGSLVAREEILVAPQIEGQRIRSLLVEAGARVTKGQPLATLATENLEETLAEVVATIAQAAAGIAQARSNITGAQARLAETAASLKRAKPLRRSGYLSQSLLEQRQSAATAARSALAVARDALKSAESQKVQAEAKRRQIQWQLARTRIVAPVDGLVLARSARVGAIATAAGEPMFRLARKADIELEGEATSDQLQRLKVGQKAQISVPGLPALSGTVRRISPRLDPSTRLGHVRIYIGADERLRVGTFAAAAIETATSKGLAVPSSAVMRDADGTFVQVVVDKRVAARRLTLGLVSGGYYEVISGLDAADQVVAKAGTFLGEGERVEPIDTSTVKPSGVSGPQAEAG